MSKMGMVYIIPSLLDEEGMPAMPSYILTAIKHCNVLFTENERTARRFLKQLSKDIVIDDFEWVTIHKSEKEILPVFKQKLKEGKIAGIISEAGCPGIADPGQILITAAHDMNVEVRPLVGPNSILLALMASGLNGQQFRFAGYLPIESYKRIKAIRELEIESKKKEMTQIFIETPYRNNQLFDALIKTCMASTRLCIATNLTSSNEFIKTKTIEYWKKNKPDLHKKPSIFCLLA